MFALRVPAFLALLMIPTLALAQPAAEVVDVAADVSTTAEADDPVEPMVVQVIRPSGIYVDRPAGLGFDPMTLLLGGGVKQKSFFKLVDAIDRIAEDDEIDAVLFDLSAPALGMSGANLHQFERHMAALRKAGKPTFAWLENAGPGHYRMACQCDEIYMADFGSLDFPSPAMSSMHYKDAMDLFGVRASVARVGSFKGAVEPYTRSRMSSHLRSHYEKLLTSINDAAVIRIAARRGLTHEQVRARQAQRIFTATTAAADDLVDHLAPYGTVRTAIEEKLGEEVRWREKVSGPKRQPSFFEVWSQLMTGNPEKAVQDPSLAVFHLSGAIVDGDDPSPGNLVAGPTVRAIEELIDDDRIKGVVLRIDSPGGSATASEAIRRALVRLSEKKPVVVSMGSVAASGGYWISCLDRPVYAEATTVTGSIGVFALKLSFGPLMQRFGVHTESIHLDESAAAMAIDREWGDEDIERIQALIRETYGRFLELVAKSRGMTPEAVDAVGGGRVWSGSQALALGLVDRLGGVDHALSAVAQECSLDEYDVVHRPRPQQGLALLDILGGGDEDEIRSLIPTGPLRLLAQRGFRVGNLLTILRSALDDRGSMGQPSATRIWLLHPEELSIR